LGCGAGVPATKLLVEKNFDVLGVDISAVQIERARQLVPGATFVQADMATWEHEPAAFDAVVSFYSLIHLPIEDQWTLFRNIRRWLRPNGYLLAIVGFERWTGVEDYLGSPMFWDHADRATYLGWLAEARLAPLRDRFVPEGSGGHTLVLAQAT
jgi:SAM-dependent methyltransferase